MSLSNTQTRYYDAEFLRLPLEKRKQYHAQVENLISKVSASIREKTKIRITKVVKALYMGATGCTWGKTTSSQIAKRVHPVRRPTHNALDDVKSP